MSQLNVNAVQFLDGTPSWALFHAQDQKPSGTHAGASVAGIQTRELNTVLTNDIPGASLSNNQVTLPAGKYFIEAIAPVYQTQQTAIMVDDVGASSTLLMGTCVYVNGTEGVSHNASVSGVITLASQTSLELRHGCRVGQGTNGLGIPAGDYFTVPYEVYADFKAWRIA